MVMEATVFEIAGGSTPPRLVKGGATKRLGRGRVKIGHDDMGSVNHFICRNVNFFFNIFLTINKCLVFFSLKPLKAEKNSRK